MRRLQKPICTCDATTLPKVHKKEVPTATVIYLTAITDDSGLAALLEHFQHFQKAFSAKNPQSHFMEFRLIHKIKKPLLRANTPIRNSHLTFKFQFW